MKKLTILALAAFSLLATETVAADRLNLWPLYGRDAEGAVDVVWPLGHFANFEEWRVFPVIKGRDELIVFPEFWFLRDSFAVLPLWATYDFSEGVLFPVAGWSFDGDGTGWHGLFPLYYYGWDARGGDSFWTCGGLVGFDRKGGEVDAHWLFPAYVWTGEDFLSIPYSRVEGYDCVTEGYLLGLAGRRAGSRRGVGYWDSWAFPLYYANSGGTLVTPLYGHTEESRWCFPIWYGDRDSFWTLPYGYVRSGSSVSTWWLTPLVGTWSGSKRGGWLFPIFSYGKDISYDLDVARLDWESIPEGISFSTRAESFTNSAGTVKVWTNVTASVDVNSRRRCSVLLLSDHDASVTGWATADGRYQLRELASHGNGLVFKRIDSRTATFDIASRRKTGESRDSTTSALLGIFRREVHGDGPDKPQRTRTRVLWKLWDCEDGGDGRVTIDAFPGFTYDAHPDGYRKASLLWRLFRYEKSPATETKLDILFIPILR